MTIIVVIICAGAVLAFLGWAFVRGGTQKPTPKPPAARREE